MNATTVSVVGGLGVGNSKRWEASQEMEEALLEKVNVREEKAELATLDRESRVAVGIGGRKHGQKGNKEFVGGFGRHQAK